MDATRSKVKAIAFQFSSRSKQYQIADYIFEVQKLLQKNKYGLPGDI